MGWAARPPAAGPAGSGGPPACAAARPRADSFPVHHRGPPPFTPKLLAMKVYEALARAFVAEGVETVFALMGDGNMGFLGSLAKAGIQVVQVRHENMAVG